MNDEVAGGRRGTGTWRRTAGRAALAVIAVLSLVLAMSAAFLYRQFNGNLHQVDVSGQLLESAPPAPEVEGPHKPLNILIMATDSRDCEGCQVDGLNGEGGSDTTILLHLSADRKTAYGVSVPRDSMVDRPRCRDKKDPSIIHPAATTVMWNQAYAIGGVACTEAQFMHNTGIPIDHYVEVNFGSFSTMVDALGGVEVCVPQTWDDPKHGIHIAAGTRKISGKPALAYVRERYVVGNRSDTDRIKRQQAFIGAMVKQALSGGTLSNPARLYRFLDAATGSLTLDMNLASLAKLALQFKDIGASGIQFITVPWEPPSWDKYRVVWSASAATLWQRILHDKPLSSAFTSEAIQVDRLPGLSGTASPSATPSGSPSGTASSSTQEPNTSAALRRAGLC
ncbi:LCP family protein [Nocardioides sp.]|uniref:LCP family protein n=1 Tax=Nocardioides sp. TaxID=35761 RepID=UPI002607D102|nr:LCP family protein [Nocardioides sp.]